MADASEKSGLAEGEPLEADEVDVEPELVAAEDADKDEPSNKTALVPQDSLGRYLSEIRRYPLLTPEEEHRLAVEYKEYGDLKVAYRLVTAKLRLEAEGFDISPKLIARRLEVKPSEVVEMDQRMSSRDVSVDTPIGSDEESTMLDLLSSEGTPEDQVVDAHYQKVVAEKMREFGETLTGKDRTIFEKRLLTEEPMTLQEIGEMYDISRERVRQIEERLKKRLKQYLLTDMRDLETVEVVNPSSRRRKRKGEVVPDAD